MKDDILAGQRCNLWLLDELLKEIPADKLTVQPKGLKNHPLWIVGHLAWACDQGALVKGTPAVCPSDWAALFGRETQPVDDPRKYPSLAQVRTTFGVGHERLAQAYLNAGEETLTKPNQHPFLAKVLPTVNAMTIFGMLGHEALHLGQLTAWKRAMGFTAMV